MRKETADGGEFENLYHTNSESTSSPSSTILDNTNRTMESHHLQTKQSESSNKAGLNSSIATSNTWLTKKWFCSRTSLHLTRGESTKRNDHERPDTTETVAKTATQKSVKLSKIIFFTFLFVVAAVAGGLLYVKLRETEEQFAKSQFQSHAQRALKDCQDALFRRRLSAESMATVVGEQFQNSSEWPFVIIQGFNKIVDRLSQIGSHHSMGFAPIVQVGEEQRLWESFIYDYFDAQVASGDFPDTTGINEFGKGIWRSQETENGTIRVHDSDEPTGSQGFLVPLAQCCVDSPGNPVLLFNEYSEKKRQDAIDGVIECSSQIKSNQERRCWAMTDFVNVQHPNLTFALASIMFQPVYPASNSSDLAGFILFPMKWVDIFDNVFSQDITGVHCVLQSYYPDDTELLLEGHGHSTVRKQFTFTIKNGKVSSIEKGDLHQSQYDADDQSLDLNTSPLPSIIQYSIHIYPTEDLITSYSTNNPRDATICALFAVALVTILFLSYDFFVQREFHERRQVLDAKRRFIRYVSHEVRSPLNAVLMGLDIIHNDENNCERKCLIQDIQNSANSAVTVLNEVLQYDKIEQKNLMLELTVIDIWKLAGTQLMEFKAIAESKNIDLKLAYDDPLLVADVESGKILSVEDLPSNVRNLRVIGDVPKILQVLRNLISNALKFTPNKGRIRLTMAYVSGKTSGEKKKRWNRRRSSIRQFILKNGEEVLSAPSGQFVLDIIDSGVGMTANQIGRLFGEGVQFNANDLQEGKGSGLGLFISKNLVEQHEGRLTATSEGLGRGSVFTLQLPLYQCNATTSLEENENPEDSLGTKSSHHKRKLLHILVVDDVSSNRKLLCRLLERNGHECRMAENGDVAVNIVQDSMSSDCTEDRFDCILMDYEMPVLNGPNATKKIRDMGCGVLIVGITGNTLSDDVQHFESMGANTVLYKPVNLRALEEVFVQFSLACEM